MPTSFPLRSAPFLVLLLLACSTSATAQRRSLDSTVERQPLQVPVTIQEVRLPDVGSMLDAEGMGIYTGKKSERILVRGIDANLSQNNTRQLFSHSPGLFLWEFNGSGLQANVAARGLNPHRSSEFGVRMNGYDIASDPYGYPEAHFTPPFESLDRVEVVRGAASLQYGAQFGGLLNYITRTPTAGVPFSFETSQFGGSYGLYSTHTAVAGNVDRLNYSGYINYRRSDAWRQNGGYYALTGRVAASYELVQNNGVEGAILGVELTALDFEEGMPNGLTEAQYAENPRASYRPRDWFGAPRVMGAVTYNQLLGDNSYLSVIASGLIGDRNSITLVSSTSVPDTGTNRRRVNRDLFRDAGVEARLRTDISLFTLSATLATGLRVARTSTNRSQGLGSDGEEFNLEYRGPKTLDLDFATWNGAAFAEVKLNLSENVALVPGVRLEYLNTNALGTYSRENSATSPLAFDTLGPATSIDRTLEEAFPLFGLGFNARLSDELETYGNIAQAYRPLLYAQQFPYDQIPVDTAITSSKGFSSDLGVRAWFGVRVARVEISGFFLRYTNRVGIIFPDSALFPRGFRTNAGSSHHYGVESYGEVNLLALADPALPHDQLNLFLSAGYTYATYVSGPAEGHEVENSPDWIVRAGLTYKLAADFTATLQASYVSSSFSDAANTVFRADGQQGIIPDYTLFDLSLGVRLTPFLRVEGSVNNILDRRYFTARATAYPGPGILPGDGRSFTAGVRVTL